MGTIAGDMRNEAKHTTAKDQLYFAGANDHVLGFLPSDARRFLEIGCAAGNLGASIKAARPGVVVHGVEMEPSSVRRAREQLDSVFEADLNEGLPELDGPYDCIVCGDVLEHLVDPWTTLRDVVVQLAPGGCVIASIPNVRHYKVLRELVFDGRFRYRESGITDATHLRFFTLTEMKGLFDSAGLRVVDQCPRLQGSNLLVRVLDRLLFGRLEEFRAVQYTLVGVRR